MTEYQDISTYEAEKCEIKFNSKSQGKSFKFSVRGLNLDDLTHLVSLHLDDLHEVKILYDQVRVDIFTKANLQKFIATMIGKCPGLCAEIISKAADRPELAATIQSLPSPITIQALSEILRMTIEDIGGLRPLQASLAAVLPAVIPPELLAALTKGMKSFAGTGVSEETRVS